MLETLLAFLGNDGLAVKLAKAVVEKEIEETGTCKTDQSNG